MEKNIDVVRATSYINANWDAQDMWDGWGQTRIETVPQSRPDGFENGFTRYSMLLINHSN